MRIVGITHNSMTNVMTDFPGVNVPYVNSISRNPQHMVPLFHSWNFIFCSLIIWWFFVQRIYSDFNVIESGYLSRKLHTSLRKLYGYHTDVEDKFATSVSHMLKGLFTNCNICWRVCLPTVTYVEWFAYRLWRMLKGLFTDCDVYWRVCLPTVTYVEGFVYRLWRMLKGLFTDCDVCGKVYLQTVTYVEGFVYRLCRIRLV